MRKKTIKYSVVDLGYTKYVVLRLADLDYLIHSHQSMSADIIPRLSDAQWSQYRSSLCAVQQIHANRVSPCKTAILSKADYDSLNMAITHLRALWITLCITGAPPDDNPSSTNQ